MDQYLVRRKRIAKERPQNKHLTPFPVQLTKDDANLIRDMLEHKDDVIDIFATIKKRNRTRDDRTIYGWIERVALGKA